MVKLKTWAAAFSLLLGAAGSAAAQGYDLAVVYVNGQRLYSTARLDRGQTRYALPMRDLFEALGARVSWQPMEKAVYAWMPDGAGVRLEVGSKTAQKLKVPADASPGYWGEVVGNYTLDSPVRMVDGQVFVPLRFASEALNSDVRFVAKPPTVYIRTEAVAGYREPDEK